MINDQMMHGKGWMDGWISFRIIGPESRVHGSLR